MSCAIILVTISVIGIMVLQEQISEQKNIDVLKYASEDNKDAKNIRVEYLEIDKGEGSNKAESEPKENTAETVELSKDKETVCEQPADLYVEQEDVYIEQQSASSYAGTYSITAYTWTGNAMANGEYPYYGSVASCDFPLGTVLYIEGVGTFTVNDVCPTSGVIDMYMDSYDECINFGRISADVYTQ